MVNFLRNIFYMFGKKAKIKVWYLHVNYLPLKSNKYKAMKPNYLGLSIWRSLNQLLHRINGNNLGYWYNREDICKHSKVYGCSLRRFQGGNRCGYFWKTNWTLGKVKTTIGDTSVV